MNYSIDELDQCIFNYLVCHQNIPKSMGTIYNDITSGSGHRCDELNNNHREKYKYRFMTAFHSVPNNFENVKKTYSNRIPYLTFNCDDLSSDSDNETVLQNQGDNFKIKSFDKFIDYLLDTDIDYDFDEPVYNHESILTHLVRAKDIDRIKILYDRKFNKKILELQSKNDAIQQENLELKTNEQYSQLQINVLQKENNDFIINNSKTANTTNCKSILVIFMALLVNAGLFFLLIR